MRRAYRFAFLAFPVAAVAMAFGGCGGDDTVAFGGDAGTDATTTDAAPPDGGGGADTGAGDAGVDAAIPCPTYSGTDTYCKALVDYCNRCLGQVEVCQLDNFSRCEQFSPILSDAGRKALVTCLGNVSCTRDGGVARRCIEDKLVKAPPTDAQATLAQDYCAACPGLQDASACATDFYVLADGGLGKGAALLEYSDTIVGAIDTTCVAQTRPDAGDGGVLGCAGKFAICALGVIGAGTPPDACKDGG